MGNTIRTPKLVSILADNEAANTVNFSPDYDPNTQRTVIVNKNTADSIALAIVGVFVDPSTGAETTVSHVLTTFAAGATHTYLLEGPIQRITLTKTGTAGAATVFIMG